MSGTTSNEPAISLSVSPASADEDGGTVQVRLSATRDTTDAADAVSVAVTVGTAASSATHGLNCPATDGCDWGGLTTATLTFGANQTSSNSVSFNVAIKDDLLSEGAETIVIGGTASGFSVTPATFTINDDDAPSTSVTVTVSPAQLAEASAKRTVTVTATLDGGSLASDLTVTFHALGGTATGGGDDYASTVTGGTNAKTTPDAVTIATGSLSASTTIDIDPNQNSVDEGASETIVFDATLSGALSGTGAGKVTPATLTIVDNDTASTAISLSVSPASVDEGASETELTVTATLGGSATYPDDQTVAVQVISVPSGGATPGADASTGDYRLTDFADTAVTGVTLPISLGDGHDPGGVEVGDGDVQGDPQRRLDLGGHRDHPCGRHPDGLHGEPRRHRLHRQRPAAAHAVVGHHVGWRERRRDPGDGDGDSGPERRVDGFAAADVRRGLGDPWHRLHHHQPAGARHHHLRRPEDRQRDVHAHPVDDRVTETGGETIVIGASHASYSVSSHSVALGDNDVASDAVILKLSRSSLAENASKTTVTVTAELNKGTLGSDVTVTFGALAGDADGGGVDYSVDGDRGHRHAKTTPDAVTITAGSDRGVHDDRHRPERRQHRRGLRGEHQLHRVAVGRPVGQMRPRRRCESLTTTRR